MTGQISSIDSYLGKLASLRDSKSLTDDEYCALRTRLVTAFVADSELPDKDVRKDISATSSDDKAPFAAELTMAEITSRAFLSKFLKGRALDYYVERFQAIVAAGKLGDCSINDITFGHLSRSWKGISWRHRMNGAGLLLGLFWASWRGVAYVWWSWAAICLLAVCVVAFDNPWLAIADKGLSFAPAVLFGFNGNLLFLLSIARKAQSGDIAAARGSGLRLAGAIAMVLGFSGLAAASFILGELGGLPSCGSDAAISTLRGIFIDTLQKGLPHRALLGIVQQPPNTTVPPNPFDVNVSQVREQPSSNRAKRYCSANVKFGYDEKWLGNYLASSTLSDKDKSLFPMAALTLGINVGSQSKSFDYTLQRTEDGDLYVEIQQ